MYGQYSVVSYALDPQSNNFHVLDYKKFHSASNVKPMKKAQYSIVNP